jgi:hypothetical protein
VTLKKKTQNANNKIINMYIQMYTKEEKKNNG